jgi:uncharacterized membrane protein
LENLEPQQNPSGPRRTEKKFLWSTGEGRILCAGVIASFLYVLWLAVHMLINSEDAQVLIGMTATQVLFGRAAAMAFGYTMELPHSVVIPVCIVLETILVLILFPLFVFSWKHLLVIKWLRRMFDRIQAAAERHQEKIRKYGIIGLFVFVWIPFWMTGPVVGCVIGFLLGIPLWINMTVVLAGTCVAVLGWAVVLKQMHAHIASYNSYAALVMLLFVVVIVVVAHFLYRTAHKINRNDHKT